MRRVLLVLLVLSVAQARAGEVGDCSDGQTCLVTSEAYSGPVRLYCISAPALAEPLGQMAPDRLRGSVHGAIQVLVNSQDEGVPIAEFIRDDGYNLGLELVSAGLAQVDRSYCGDLAYVMAEHAAQDAGLGIWAKPRGEGFKCRGPRYCKQVQSCKEAMFYLTRCGRTDFDRDRDGVPCEGICPAR